MDYKYMEIALLEAEKSYETNDVPVGAIIVKDNEIISKAHNIKEYTKKVTDHAEILAIEEACKKTNDWRLEDCIMYVTLEPCLMCYGAILQSRISKVIYATPSQKYGFTNYIDNSSINNNKVVKIDGILTEKSQKMLKEFFEDKRN